MVMYITYVHVWRWHIYPFSHVCVQHSQWNATRVPAIIIMSVSCIRGSRIRQVLFECSVDDENEFSIRRRLGARAEKISTNPAPLYMRRQIDISEFKRFCPNISVSSSNASFAILIFFSTRLMISIVLDSFISFAYFCEKNCFLECILLVEKLSGNS